MIIDELRIDDFGCFRGARLDDIEDGLIVIGGPQRAGKTTFMQALRQFPDGVSRGGDLPEPTNEYQIDADISHLGNSYRYQLTGFSDPVVSPIDGGSSLSPEDIFEPISPRQYRNLYTISLDELRRLPDGIDNSEDLARILLGGAYGDIADIPELEDKFDSRADDIGLSRGDPTAKTTQLHGPYSQIQDGIEARREASNQVEQHDSKSAKLKEKRGILATTKDELESAELKRDRLSILLELYDTIEEIRELELALDDKDVAAAKNFPHHKTDRGEHYRNKFNEAVEALSSTIQTFEERRNFSHDEYYEWLVDHESKIEALNDNLKVWKQQISDLKERGDELDQELDEIESTIKSLRPEWDGSFEPVKNIDPNLVDSGRVTTRAEKLEELLDERDELEAEVSRKQRKIKELDDSIGDDTEPSIEVKYSWIKPVLVAVAAIIGSTGLALIGAPIIGGILGLIILIFGFYLIDWSIKMEESPEIEPIREAKSEIKRLNAEISGANDRLSEIEPEIEDLMEDIGKIQNQLELPEDLEPTEITNFYNQVIEISSQIDSYETERDKWKGKVNDLGGEIQDTVDLLSEVDEIEWNPDDPLEYGERVLSSVGLVHEDLELAKDVQEKELERASSVKEIDNVLSDWDNDLTVKKSDDDEEIRECISQFLEQAEEMRTVEQKADKLDGLQNDITASIQPSSAKNAFDPVKQEDEDWIDVVRREANSFTDKETIDKELDRVEERIEEELEEKKEELNDEILELQQEIESLASEDDLREAQSVIDNAYVEFERLGEAYAVNRIAEQMVKKLHQQMMEEVVHSLVEDASEIFSDITLEYEGIELGDDIQNLEFRAIRDGQSDHTVDQLSRATAEQLFLAVRLARIRQTDNRLPVVLDDATTNFDPGHASRVFEFIDQFTNDTQVFFLTCHPEYIRLISDKGTPAQYWSLQDGKFEVKDDGPELEEILMSTI